VGGGGDQDGGPADDDSMDIDPDIEAVRDETADDAAAGAAGDGR
jgi:hypothetical protein